MNFIDVFDFSKYFKRDGDGKRAKIGHINHVIEELGYTETIINISASEILDVGYWVNDGYGVTLLPELPIGSKYDIHSLIFKYTFVDSPYTLFSPNALITFGFADNGKWSRVGSFNNINNTNDTTVHAISAQILEEPDNAFVILSNINQQTHIKDYVVSSGSSSNIIKHKIQYDRQSFKMYASNIDESFNCVDGDGTIQIKIYHKTLTF